MRLDYVATQQTPQSKHERKLKTLAQEAKIRWENLRDSPALRGPGRLRKPATIKQVQAE